MYCPMKLYLKTHVDISQNDEYQLYNEIKNLKIDIQDLLQKNMRKLNKTMNLDEMQLAIWQNKLDKNFNTTDVEQEFEYLKGEVKEAYDAWKEKKDDFGLELADVAIYLRSSAQMNGYSLKEQIEQKIAINKKRKYVLENGVWVKKIIK